MVLVEVLLVVVVIVMVVVLLVSVVVKLLLLLGGKLLLITNRKSHMGFRLVPKSVTLNDLEQRNGRLVCVISPNWVAFGPFGPKVVEDTWIHSTSEM